MGRTRQVLSGIVVAVLVVAAGAWGVRLVLTRAQGTPQAVEVEQAVLPSRVEGAAVVGIGEATHGTRELNEVLSDALLAEGARG